jgi:septal ring factor EnvC (AmiA/AmiB activator)
MKKILKMAYLEGISMREARIRQSTLYSAAARRPAPRPQDQHDQNPLQQQEMAALNAQIQALQEEVKSIKENTINRIQEEMETLAADLSETKEKITNFNIRFDKMERSQEEIVKKQESAFDRLEFLLNGLIGQLTLNTSNQAQPYNQAATTVDRTENMQAISPTRRIQTSLGNYPISPMFASTPTWNEDMDNEDYQDA